MFDIIDFISCYIFAEQLQLETNPEYRQKQLLGVR